MHDDSGVFIASPSSSKRLACPPNDAHATAWTDILLNKPTLATFTKRMARKGFCLKRGPSNRNIMNWKRVFLLLQYPFLLYFGSNDPSTECLGVVYIGQPLQLQVMPHYPSVQHVLQLRPCVRRNLHHKSSSEDEDNFYFCFDDAKTLEEWTSSIRSEIDRGLQEELDEAFVDTLVSHASDDDDDSAVDGAEREPSQSFPLNHPTATIVLDESHPSQTSAEQCNDSLASSNVGNSDDDAPQSVDRTASAKRSEESGDDPFVIRSRQSSVTSQSQRSSSVVSAVPHFEDLDVRRKSFFSTADVVECVNSEAVHRTHCRRCKVAPVVGFLYTCVVCDDEVLCGSCFRIADHDMRHLFLVAPDVDGECLRLMPSLEGDVFRQSELIVFEALFRVVGNDVDGNPTAPISKRRLISFWNCCCLSQENYRSSSRHTKTELPGRAQQQEEDVLLVQGSSLPIDLSLTEKDLTLLCRAHDTVTFPEFMFIVRCKLASVRALKVLIRDSDSLTPAQMQVAMALCDVHVREGAFLLIALAFSILRRMLTVFRSGTQTANSSPDLGLASSPLYRLSLSQSGGVAVLSTVAPSSVPGSRGNITELEDACFQMFLGSCSVAAPDTDDEQVPWLLVAQLLQCLQLRSVAEGRSAELLLENGVDKLMSDLFPRDKRAAPRDGDEEFLPAPLVSTTIVRYWENDLTSPTLGLVRRSSKRLLTPPAEALRAAVPLKTPSYWEHGLVEAVEHVMCLEVGGVFGLYSDQLETLHADACSCCSVCPIVGFAYALEPQSSANGVPPAEAPLLTGGLSVQYCQSCLHEPTKWVTHARSVSTGTKSTTVKLRKRPGDVVAVYDMRSGKVVVSRADGR